MMSDMDRDPEMQAFVDAYQQAWASRVPSVMGEMWHRDGSSTTRRWAGPSPATSSRSTTT